MLVLKAGCFINGTGREPKKDITILIAGERIKGIGSSKTVEIPPDSDVVDLSKYTILPGLIDSHVHFFCPGRGIP